ncbi:MAG: hypothetical protein RDU30_04985 [Desulfovibrionaceae bacterium]|nr:hypothetical protein [Desulfovibrionaceae bacterium]
MAIPTGPHLGEFNGRISAPELIEFTACAAAACVAGRYFAEASGPVTPLTPVTLDVTGKTPS